MSVSIPSNYNITIPSVGPVGPIAAGVNVAIDSLPKIRVGTLEAKLTELPVVEAKLTELPVIEAKLTELPTINLGPLNLNLRWQELPSVRGHVPSYYNFSLNLFGMELMSFKVCGETQLITEPYKPYPCEQCPEGEPPASPPPQSTPPTDKPG